MIRLPDIGVKYSTIDDGIDILTSSAAAYSVFSILAWLAANAWLVLWLCVAML